MKKYIILFFIFLLPGVLLFTRCGGENDRQIKLAPRPMGAIMQDKVKIIRIAVEEKKKIAILDFENASNINDAEWLQNGLMRMLASSLKQSRQLIVLQASIVHDVLSHLDMRPQDVKNSRACQRLASALKAEAIIQGFYRIKDDSLTVKVLLYDGQNGELLGAFTGVARTRDMESLKSAVTKLAWQLRIDLEEKQDALPEVNRSLADVSTNSLEAYKNYLAGVEKREQFLMPEAIAFFNKAIELDSTFASAYFGLAYSMATIGLVAQSRPILEKAVKYSEYLPERERLPILAMNAMVKGEPFKAVAIYNKAIALFPEDDEVHYQLGNYYFSMMQDYPRAIERFETAIELNPRHKLAHNQLAYAYARIGEMEHALYILEKYAELAPNEPNPYDSYGEILQREGRLDEAVQKFKMALKIKPDFWPARLHLASAYQDLGKFRKAKTMLKAMLADTTFAKQKRTTLSMLAWHEIVIGDVKEAEKIWQSILAEDANDISALLSLLALRPESEIYRRQFVQFVDAQLQQMRENRFSVDYLFPMLLAAFRYNLAIDKIERAFDSAASTASDPVFSRAIAAYKLIIDFQKGRVADNTSELFLKSQNAQVLQLIRPASWDEYWRFYFDGLRKAQQNGVNVKPWVKGLQHFAGKSNNAHFRLQSKIVLAASEYYSGNREVAENMLASVSIPCERFWKFIGPFNMTRGFDEKFWPEKRSVGEWLSQEKYAKAMFQGHDDLFDGYIDLKQIGNTSYNDAVYALLQINAPTFKDAQLRIGMSGKLKVWLNDKPVMIKNIHGKAIIDNYITTVRLRPGANRLLLRLNTPVGEMGFYFRLTDKNGGAIEQVDFNAPSAFAEKNAEIQNGVKKGV